MSSLTAVAAIRAYNINKNIVPETISDSAADLLNNWTGFTPLLTAGKIASLTLTGANTVSAAQAIKLAQLPGFSLDAGATLVISDNAANLLSASLLPGFNMASSLTLTGDSTVNVATANALSQLKNLTETPQTVLHVVDSVTNLLTLTNSNGLSLATYVIITGANQATAAQVTALAGTHRFGGFSGSSLTVSDTAANVLANVAAVGRYASNTVVTGQNTIVAADLVTLSAVYHMTLGAGAALIVNDTAANRSSAMATISGLTPRAGYGAPAGVQFILSGTPVSSAAGLQSEAATISFSIADTGANLTATALISFESDDKLTGITVTDSATLAMSYSQYVGLTHVVSLIAGNFSVSLTGVPVSAAASIQSDARISGFSVTDTFSNVFANNAALQNDSKLNHVSGIDPTIPLPFSGSGMSFYGQFNPGSLSLADVPVAMASAVSQLASVAAFTITDTAANFAGQTSTFADLPQVSGVTVTGTSGGDTIDLTGVVLPVTTIDLGGNSASVSAGLSAPALSFIGSPDAVVLGSGPSTVLFALGSGSGIETISHFTYGLDLLNIDGHGATAGAFQAFDTTVNGVNAISISSTADPTHGVVLLGVTANQTASDLLANHTSFANGHFAIT
jgi:hypothetical protein